MESTMSEEAASSSSSVSWQETDAAAGQQNGYAQHSPTKAKPSGKIVKPKPLVEVLNKMLPLLQRRDLYQFFTQPVPAAEVPEYYTIVQRPMDFSTMQQKLEQGEYHSLDSFRVSAVLHSIYCHVLYSPCHAPYRLISFLSRKMLNTSTALTGRAGLFTRKPRSCKTGVSV